MIRLEPIVGRAFLARVYAEDDPGPMAQFGATFVLECGVEPGTMWIKGMQGRITRRDIRDLVRHLHDLGVHTALAKRVEGHTLPFGVAGEDGTVRMSVLEAAKRWRQQPDAA